MKNNKVFARGYDKFFRVDELGGWSKVEFKGTVHAYKKYNGLLGLLTSDGKELVYMSKGTVYTPNNEGKYAKLVKDVISKQLEDKPDAIDFLIKFLEDKTMLFEVVDEEKDPHIVHNFDKPTAVMLDIVYNSLVFKKLGYKALVSVANKVQLPVKEQLGSFSSDVRKNVEAIVKDKELEGVVLEDSTGFMTKAKTFLYTEIKARRSSWDYEIKNDRVSLNEFSKRLAHISGRDYSETVGQDAYTKGNIKKFDNVLKEEIVKPNPEKNLLNIRKENGLLI